MNFFSINAIVDLDKRMNTPDGGHPALQRIVGGALKTDRAGFGHAVGDGDVAHVHRLVDAAHHLDRAGRAGHDAGAQRGQVEFCEFGMIELGDEHGRHAVERRHFSRSMVCNVANGSKPSPG